MNASFILICAQKVIATSDLYSSLLARPLRCVIYYRLRQQLLVFITDERQLANILHYAYASVEMIFCQ